MPCLQGTPEGVEDNGSLTRVAAFPIGIDPERFAQALEKTNVKAHIAQLLNRYAGRKVHGLLPSPSQQNLKVFALETSMHPPCIAVQGAESICGSYSSLFQGCSKHVSGANTVIYICSLQHGCKLKRRDEGAPLHSFLCAGQLQPC